MEVDSYGDPFKKYEQTLKTIFSKKHSIVCFILTTMGLNTQEISLELAT
jgi:hypothetical protein